MKIYIYLLLTLPLFLSCNDEHSYGLDDTEISRIDLYPGFQTHSISTGGGEEFVFGMWVPIIQSNEKVPLIVALHYAPPGTLYLGDQYMKRLVQPALDSLGAIIVAPDVPGNNWLAEKSDILLMRFIDIIKEKWPVNNERIIITGYSMGGIGTWYYADKYPEEFCAAIPMASWPTGFLTGKVPHYVIQGSYDEEFGTDPVRIAVNVMKSKHKRAELIIAEGLNHGEVEKYIPYLKQSISWINLEVNKSK